MISVFDTNPVVFESTDRTLTVSYNGVLCKDQIVTIRLYLETTIGKI